MKPWRTILDAPPERLALFRIAVGLYVIVYLLARLIEAWSTSRATMTSFAPVGLVSWLNVSDPLPVGGAMALYLLTIVFTLAFTVGYRFALTGPLCAFLLLWTTSYKSSFGMLFHSENLVTLQVMVLGLGPSAQSVSLDARANRRSWTEDIPSGWPLLASSLVAIVAYGLAGIAKLKLGGMDWVSGDVLRVQVAYDNLRKIEFGSPHSPLGAWSVRYPLLFLPLGIITMLAELGGPLALIHRHLALTWVILVVGFHWGVLFLMAITFSYPMVGIPFFCFFELEKTKLGRLALVRLSKLLESTAVAS